MPQHTHHITLPIYITPFQFERLELHVIRFCNLRLSFAYNLLYRISIEPNTKMVKKCNFIHKVPEKVMPVCPNTNLFWVHDSLFNHNICWSEPAALGENDCCFSSSSFFLLTPSVCRTNMLYVVDCFSAGLVIQARRLTTSFLLTSPGPCSLRVQHHLPPLDLTWTLLKWCTV